MKSNDEAKNIMPQAFRERRRVWVDTVVAAIVSANSLGFRSAQHLSAQVPAFVPKATKVTLTMRR